MMPDWLRVHRIANSPLLFGLMVGCLTWCVSMALQIWLIPYLFSTKGAVDGLVVLDSIGFHRQALEQADFIRENGWLAWCAIHTSGEIPALIATIMYVLFGSSPLSMLVFNAVMHGLTASIVLLILRKFFDRLPSALGALAFAANPTSLEWVSQIHRDGIFVLGSTLFVLALINSFDTRTISAKPLLSYPIPSTAGLMFLSSLLIAVSRPYWLLVLFGIFSFVTLAAFLFVTCFKQLTFLFRPTYRQATLTLICSGFILFVVFIFSSDSKKPLAYSSLPSMQNTAPAVRDSDPITIGRKRFEARWAESAWLPRRVDSIFYNVFILRTGALQSKGNTLVDSDRPLDSAIAQIFYLPRAIQLGLLSPFPELWGGLGSTSAMTFARKISGVITVVGYFFLLSAVIGIYRLRKKPEVWILVASCLIGITAFAITYPNIGALIRFRYANYMLLVAFGVATFAAALQRRYSFSKTLPH